MKRYIFGIFAYFILLSSIALAGSYRSRNYIIYSDLDPRFIKFLQANAEVYYEAMEHKYFQTGGRKPIIIYYSKTQADTQALFDRKGIKSKAYYGLYLSSGPAIYTHQLMNTGSGTGWGTLFHEITHHFVGLNYQQAPAWFNEGLACILGEQTRIVKDNLNVGRPNPWREHVLRDMIEEGFQIDVRHLTSLSSKDFNENRNIYHPTRALFYWLHEIECLAKYLQAVKQKGYGLSVLEDTVGLKINKINAELLTFIKKHCYAGAYLYDSRLAKDNIEKEEALLKSLELKPDYKAAHLGLAWLYYKNKDNQRCREHVIQILNDYENIEYPDAAKLIGHSYYAEKNFSEALKYYGVALDYSGYIEYQYELYYWMGDCYHRLKDYVAARKMHKLFLDNNWEPTRLSKMVHNSKEYLKIMSNIDEETQ